MAAPVMLFSHQGCRGGEAARGPGNSFGEIGSLSAGTQGAYAEALDDTLLCLWRKPDAERILQTHPQLALPAAW